MKDFNFKIVTIYFYKIKMTSKNENKNSMKNIQVQYNLRVNLKSPTPNIMLRPRST